MRMPINFTDEKLYQLCLQYGREALEARRKFLGLLPEVQRRGLWRDKGFNSIFEFAARLAGVSEELVRRTLNLEERFVDKPLLHAALVEGKVSIHKLVQIASVVTAQNQEFWATQAELLSKAALETLVRDEKILQLSVPGNTNSQQSILEVNVSLKVETAKRLKALREKGIDIDVLINAALDKREEEIAREKNEIAESVNEVVQSRYIPVRVKRIIAKEFGDKCSIATCQKLAENIHHTQRFALSGSHDPHYLAPLCREHHEIAHAVDQRWRNIRAR